MKLKSNAQIARENAAKQAQKKGSGKVRYVRTAAGQKRYGRSIGDVIVAGEKMENIKHEDPVYPGWDLIRGKNGVKYDVGKVKGKFVAYVHNSENGLAVTADSHEDLLRQLNGRVDRVKQTIKPRYEREGRQKMFAPDGTPIESTPDGAQGYSRQESARKGTSGRSKTSGTRGTSKGSSRAESMARDRKKEVERKQRTQARAKAAKAAEKGEYEGSSLTGLRQLSALALGSGGKDNVRNRKHSEALMKILEAQGLVQPATSKSTRKDPLAERKGKTSSSTRKWEPAEGFTMSQVARSIRYDVAIDRILFQWDEDRRNSKG